MTRWMRISQPNLGSFKTCDSFRLKIQVRLILGHEMNSCSSWPQPTSIIWSHGFSADLDVISQGNAVSRPLQSVMPHSFTETSTCLLSLSTTMHSSVQQSLPFKYFICFWWLFPRHVLLTSNYSLNVISSHTKCSFRWSTRSSTRIIICMFRSPLTYTPG